MVLLETLPSKITYFASTLHKSIPECIVKDTGRRSKKEHCVKIKLIIENLLFVYMFKGANHKSLSFCRTTPPLATSETATRGVRAHGPHTPNQL